jgi:uncharacterized membrane protein
VSSELRSPVQITILAVHGNPEAIIQFGLLLLIATPIVRVIVAGVGFFLEKDSMYVWVSLAVLAVLLFSLWHSH